MMSKVTCIQNSNLHRYINYECLMTFLYMREVYIALLFRDFNSSCMARISPRGVAASVNCISLLQSGGMSSRMRVS